MHSVIVFRSPELVAERHEPSSRNHEAPKRVERTSQELLRYQPVSGVVTLRLDTLCLKTSDRVQFIRRLLSASYLPLDWERFLRLFAACFPVIPSAPEIGLQGLRMSEMLYMHEVGSSILASSSSGFSEISHRVFLINQESMLEKSPEHFGDHFSIFPRLH